MMVELGISLDLVAAIIGHEAGGRDTRTLVRHYVRTDLIERKRKVAEVRTDPSGQGVGALDSVKQPPIAILTDKGLMK